MRLSAHLCQYFLLTFVHNVRDRKTLEGAFQDPRHPELNNKFSEAIKEMRALITLLPPKTFQ